MILEGAQVRTGLRWESRGARVCPLRAFGAGRDSHGHMRPDSGAGGSSAQDAMSYKAFQMFALLVCFIYLFVLSGNNRERGWGGGKETGVGTEEPLRRGAWAGPRGLAVGDGAPLAG